MKIDEIKQLVEEVSKNSAAFEKYQDQVAAYQAALGPFRLACDEYKQETGESLEDAAEKIQQDKLKVYHASNKLSAADLSSNREIGRLRIELEDSYGDNVVPEPDKNSTKRGARDYSITPAQEKHFIGAFRTVINESNGWMLQKDIIEKVYDNLGITDDDLAKDAGYYKDKKYSGAKKYKEMLKSEGEFTKIPTCLYKAGEIEKGVEKKDTGKTTTNGKKQHFIQAHFAKAGTKFTKDIKAVAES